MGRVAEGCNSISANGLKGDNLGGLVFFCLFSIDLSSPWAALFQHCKPESPYTSEVFYLRTSGSPSLQHLLAVVSPALCDLEMPAFNSHRMQINNTHESVCE